MYPRILRLYSLKICFTFISWYENSVGRFPLLSRRSRDGCCEIVHLIRLISYLTENELKSFCKSQFLHKLVNLSFSITDSKNELTDLCGNKLLQSGFINTYCEIISRIVKIPCEPPGNIRAQNGGARTVLWAPNLVTTW